MKTAEKIDELLNEYYHVEMTNKEFIEKLNVIQPNTKTLQDKLKQSEFYRNQYGDRLAVIEQENEKLKEAPQPDKTVEDEASKKACELVRANSPKLESFDDEYIMSVFSDEWGYFMEGFKFANQPKPKDND